MRNIRRLPHADRLLVFSSSVTFGMMLILLFCLSVYVISLPVKAMLMLVGTCLFLNTSKTISPAVAPLLLIPLYDFVVSALFPGSKPDVWTILERPLFLALCVLVTSVSLSRKSLGRLHVLIFGILGVSLVGIAGDAMGIDMVSLLPFQMPDDAYFDQVTMDQSGDQRIRGFFPESGVLGAVCLSVATCAALGGMVLQAGKRRDLPAPLIWISATVIGLIILGTTLTKSGICLLASGLAGFFLVLLISRNPACRMMAVFGGIATALAAAAFVLLAPGDLGAYMRSELGTALNLQAQSGGGGGTGLATRIECWKLALCTLITFPFGVGAFGLESVLNRCPWIVPTPEMNFFFGHEMWGLKSGLANLIAETGVVGMGLLGYWLLRGFVRPIFAHLASGSRQETFVAGLYGAAALMAVTFFFSCELYPCLALMLVFKIYADAIALACARPPVVEDAAPENEAEPAPAPEIETPELEPVNTP